MDYQLCVGWYNVITTNLFFPEHIILTLDEKYNNQCEPKEMGLIYKFKKISNIKTQWTMNRKSLSDLYL